MSILALSHLMDAAHGNEQVVAGGTSGQVGAPLHYPCPLDHKGILSPSWQGPALPQVLTTEDHTPPHPNLFFGNFFLFEKERDLHVPECHCRIRGSRLLMLPFLNNSESLQA